MAIVSAGRFLNESDKKYFTIYVEWESLSFKIVLLEHGTEAYSGQMTTEDISYFASELTKSNIVFLSETRDIFDGKNKEVQFFVQNGVLEWKQKNIWTLGRITLHPLSDITTIFDSMRQLVTCYQNLEEKFLSLEVENKSLHDVNARLTFDTEEMIKHKKTMEEDLYKRFLLILNEKKGKISELESILKEHHNSSESAFHACTDESNGGNDDDGNSINYTKTSPRKRKTNNENKYHATSDEKKSISNTHFNADLQNNPTASTSTDFSHFVNADNKNDLDQVIKCTSENDQELSLTHTRVTRITTTEFRKLAVHFSRCQDEDNKAISRPFLTRPHEINRHEGQARKVRKYCKNCYKCNVVKHGRETAKNMTKKVSTFCADCADRPHLCLPCFNAIHRQMYI